MESYIKKEKKRKYKQATNNFQLQFSFGTHWGVTTNFQWKAILSLIKEIQGKPDLPSNSSPKNLFQFLKIQLES